MRSSVQKTAEPIEMLFGLWAQVGPRNHVLDESYGKGGLILKGKGGGLL